MLVSFLVASEAHQRWPAKGDKPGGEGFDLVLMDQSLPANCRMRTMVNYRLDETERAQLWGKVADRQVRVAIHEIVYQGSRPVLRGEIMEVVGEPKIPFLPKTGLDTLVKGK